MVSAGEYSTFEVASAIIPKVGGSLSLIACTFIMRDVSTKWHRKRSVSLASVLIFCISIADWLYSLFCCFLSTWMAPVGHSTLHGQPIFLAAGNTQSCTAQGFISTLALSASMSYYATLMVFYWMSVHYSWSEAKTKKYRWYFILPPAIIAFGVALPPLFYEMYNFGGLYSCFIASYPADCEFTPEHNCERGEGALLYHDIYWVYGMFLLIIIIIFVCLLIYKVFSQERKHDKYLTKGQSKRRINTRKTIWQGMRYVGAFALAYFSLYIITIYRWLNKVPPICIGYLVMILPPLLGLFNSFVYFRPRFIAYRENNVDSSWISALGNVFDINLDYLSESSSRMSKRLSSISRRSIAGTIGSRMASGSSTGGDSIDGGDLTSPLFQADGSMEEEEEKISSSSSKSVTFDV